MTKIMVEDLDSWKRENFPETIMNEVLASIAPVTRIRQDGDGPQTIIEIARKALEDFSPEPDCKSEPEQATEEQPKPKAPC